MSKVSFFLHLAPLCTKIVLSIFMQLPNYVSDITKYMPNKIFIIISSVCTTRSPSCELARCFLYHKFISQMAGMVTVVPCPHYVLCLL